MSRLVFDIETIGEDFESLDEISKESLTKWVEKYATSEEDKEAKLQEIKEGLGFSPLTGEVVAIGVLDYEKDQGAVYYQAPGDTNKDFEKDGIIFRQMTEAEMLKHFWKGVSEYDEFVTFNGRSFDVPFLVARSAKHKIKPSKDLMSNRYLSSQRDKNLHIDLYDQLSYYGAVRRAGNLHMWCRHFGIKSPKAEGVTGDDVAKLFREKKFQDIAKYNVRDIRSTRELYTFWNKYIKF
jgi:DNA polymerase elongation subunit (family B)